MTSFISRLISGRAEPSPQILADRARSLIDETSRLLDRSTNVDRAVLKLQLDKIKNFKTELTDLDKRFNIPKLYSDLENLETRLSRHMGFNLIVDLLGKAFSWAGVFSSTKYEGETQVGYQKHFESARTVSSSIASIRASHGPSDLPAIRSLSLRRGSADSSPSSLSSRSASPADF